MPSMYSTQIPENSMASGSTPTSENKESKNYLRYFESSCGSLVENEFNNRKNPSGLMEMGIGMRSPMSYLRMLELQRQQNMKVLKERAWEGA
ncbi:unnamed protein product [Bursaphelenchus xylophilus]|uniref:(pine wood nematode) hypothetical protein n=1 Tax=Bursaphelenchus xylophilus TaxID=6326 RepID=A0A1I7RJY4_BURXY|nr:unnamed protein product [Bursaphelenchus xylophilus]CAG9131637.1 unnamed protein product [Bursaphelenchus xylophilus]